MSKKTRINRPTTATPRKVGTQRMVHQSTHLHTIDTPAGPKVLKAPGSTYRKQQG
jgi:hypothetical protein